MDVIKAREAWLRDRRTDYGDQETEDAATEAFAAGWNAARPTIRGTATGHLTHDGATAPGELQVTLWGHTKRGREIALVMTEAEAVRLRENLDRIGIGL